MTILIPRAVTLLGCVAVGLSGCIHHNDDPVPIPPPPAPNTARAAVTPLYRYPSDAPVADSLAVSRMVEKYRGSVVLLYFWSRLSDDCRAELPRIVGLQQKYRDGLRVIACNADDPNDWEGLTRPLLMSVRGHFPCVIVPEAAREPLRTWLDSRWKYEWPAGFVFNRQGVRTAGVYSASGSTFGAIEAAIREQLGDGEAADSVASGVRVHIKLIDLRSGHMVRAFSPVDSANSAGLDQVAEEMSKLIPPSRRVAVLPFGEKSDPKQTDANGMAAAERLSRGLSLAGERDVVGPADSQAKLLELGLSASEVELDPAALSRRWRGADYAVVGWCEAAATSRAVRR